MQTFEITVTEILKGTFSIEAESREQALKLFEEDYFKHANDFYLELNDTIIE